MKTLENQLKQLTGAEDPTVCITVGVDSFKTEYNEDHFYSTCCWKKRLLLSTLQRMWWWGGGGGLVEEGGGIKNEIR